jgi:hypothetical protein
VRFLRVARKRMSAAGILGILLRDSQGRQLHSTSCSHITWKGLSLPMIKMLMILKLMTRNSAQAMRTFLGHVAL